jgi:hypothetical protein
MPAKQHARVLDTALEEVVPEQDKSEDKPPIDCQQISDKVDSIISKIKKRKNREAQ